MNFRNSFHPYAMVTILFWSMAFVLTRLTLQHFSVFSLGFLRYVIASCILLVIALVTKMSLPRKQDIPLFLLSGFVGFAFYMVAFNQGQAAVSAATASILIATAPLITALEARFLFGEKLKGSQWFAILLEFAGVAVLTLLNGDLTVNAGLVWLLLAAFSLSIYNLLQRRLTKTYSAMQTTSYSIFFGTVLLAVFAPAAVGEAASAPWIQWCYLILLGIGPSAIAYVCWAKAFAKAKNTSSVSNYMFVTPFLTSLLGFLLINEVPDRATVLGGSMILLGVLIFNLGKERR